MVVIAKTRHRVEYGSGLFIDRGETQEAMPLVNPAATTVASVALSVQTSGRL